MLEMRSNTSRCREALLPNIVEDYNDENRCAAKSIEARSFGPAAAVARLQAQQFSQCSRSWTDEQRTTPHR